MDKWPSEIYYNLHSVSTKMGGMVVFIPQKFDSLVLAGYHHGDLVSAGISDGLHYLNVPGLVLANDNFSLFQPALYLKFSQEKSDLISLLDKHEFVLNFRPFSLDSPFASARINYVSFCNGQDFVHD